MTDFLTYQHILAYLSPQGMAIREWEQRLGQTIPRRSLQRAIREMLDAGLLEKRGLGRAARYYPVASEQAERSITLAADAKAIVPMIRRPVQQRTPSSYNIDFLRDYRPNQTFYLNALSRRQLSLLGETGQQPPAGTYGREILERVLIDLSWASSALEGNTYSRLDTERLILIGEAAAGKDILETQMILNHKDAIAFLIDHIQDIGLDPHTFLNLHGILSEGLMPDPSASGRLRRRPVDIGGSVYKPHAVPQVIEEAFREILEKGHAIHDPFEQAFFLMVHIPYLQPFDDVNKRVSRLGANIPFLKHNLCPLTFLDMPERPYIDGYLALYELGRIEILRDVFLWAYERSAQEYSAVRKTLTPPDPLRLRYRNQIHDLVHAIVTQNIQDPFHFITQETASLPVEHRQDFIDLVLDDLKRLHEGNCARYRLNLPTFQDWKRLW
jgi:Fic family protein